MGPEERKWHPCAQGVVGDWLITGPGSWADYPLRKVQITPMIKLDEIGALKACTIAASKFDFLWELLNTKLAFLIPEKQHTRGRHTLWAP